MQSHFIPAAHDHHVPEVTAASVLALTGVFGIIGVTGSGGSDRVDPRRLTFAFHVLCGTSLALLIPLLAGPRAGLVAFAVVHGLAWVATVPPTVALTTAVFGRERAGVVFGWRFCAHMVGGAAAAWTAGTLGDYVAAFAGVGRLAVAAGFASPAVARDRPAGRAHPAGVGATASGA